MTDKQPNVHRDIEQLAGEAIGKAIQVGTDPVASKECWIWLHDQFLALLNEAFCAGRASDLVVDDPDAVRDWADHDHEDAPEVVTTVEVHLQAWRDQDGGR